MKKKRSGNRQSIELHANFRESPMKIPIEIFVHLRALPSDAVCAVIETLETSSK